LWVVSPSTSKVRTSCSRAVHPVRMGPRGGAGAAGAVPHSHLLQPLPGPLRGAAPPEGLEYFQGGAKRRSHHRPGGPTTIDTTLLPRLRCAGAIAGHLQDERPAYARTGGSAGGAASRIPSG